MMSYFVVCCHALKLNFVCKIQKLYFCLRRNDLHSTLRRICLWRKLLWRIACDEMVCDQFVRDEKSDIRCSYMHHDYSVWSASWLLGINTWRNNFTYGTIYDEYTRFHPSTRCMFPNRRACTVMSDPVSPPAGVQEYLRSNPVAALHGVKVGQSPRWKLVLPRCMSSMYI